jgi:hypothetical protein
MGGWIGGVGWGLRLQGGNLGERKENRNPRSQPPPQPSFLQQPAAQHSALPNPQTRPPLHSAAQHQTHLLPEPRLALRPRADPQLVDLAANRHRHNRRRRLQPSATAAAPFSKKLVAPVAVLLVAEAARRLLRAPGLLQLPAREAAAVDGARAGAGRGGGAVGRQADPAGGGLVVVSRLGLRMGVAVCWRARGSAAAAAAAPPASPRAIGRRHCWVLLSAIDAQLPDLYACRERWVGSPGFGVGAAEGSSGVMARACVVVAGLAQASAEDGVCPTSNRDRKMMDRMNMLRVLAEALQSRENWRPRGGKQTVSMPFPTSCTDATKQSPHAATSS